MRQSNLIVFGLILTFSKFASGQAINAPAVEDVSHVILSTIHPELKMGMAVGEFRKFLPTAYDNGQSDDNRPRHVFFELLDKNGKRTSLNDKTPVEANKLLLESYESRIYVFKNGTLNSIDWSKRTSDGQRFPDEIQKIYPTMIEKGEPGLTRPMKVTYPLIRKVEHGNEVHISWHLATEFLGNVIPSNLSIFIFESDDRFTKNDSIKPIETPEDRQCFEEFVEYLREK